MKVANMSVSRLFSREGKILKGGQKHTIWLKTLKDTIFLKISLKTHYFPKETLKIVFSIFSIKSKNILFWPERALSLTSDAHGYKK
jgi:hypothetical protein